MEQIYNFINGKFSLPNSNKYIKVIEPATGVPYAKVPDSNNKDVDQAINSASKAFTSWSKTTVQNRSNILHQIAKGIDAHSDRLAEIESRDTGKPISLSKSVDIPRAAENFRFFAEHILTFDFEKIVDGNGSINKIVRNPIGVVGCISPWNLPLYLFTWKILPAIASGNCVVGKPSELTPYTAYELGKICNAAGLPKGVLNIVHGSGKNTGTAITKHPMIKAISFTGGTVTGKEINHSASKHLKKVSLEMGGKNPTIIFADCDFPKMLDTTIKSSFSNQGAICLCGSRILIEESIYKKFRSAFVNRVRELEIGDPVNNSTELGALISKDHLEKVYGYIKLAKKEGATILTGGNKILFSGRLKDGYFMEPTVIEGLDKSCRTNQEEIFGPIVSLIPFSSEPEVINIANATDYGLAASIWSEDLDKASRIAGEIDFGIVWLNCWMVRDLRTPFGGTKKSGLGREGGDAGLEFFTEPKNICMTEV